MTIAEVVRKVLLDEHADVIREAVRAVEWSCRSPRSVRAATAPSILEPRRRSEQALLSVVQQAYVRGVSTRRVDQLVESLGPRISKSEVSPICGALDEHVEAFRTRPLEGRYPYPLDQPPSFKTNGSSAAVTSRRNRSLSSSLTATITQTRRSRRWRNSSG